MVSGGRSEDFITGREHKKKLSAGGRVVSGRRSEDFITGREHKKKLSAGGRGMTGRRSEDFIIGREEKKSLQAENGRRWREHRNISLPVRGGWVCGRKCGDFGTGRWPRSRNVI